MKIWQGYGSEHSANLVIIGHFKDAGHAATAKQLLDKLTSIALDDGKRGEITAGTRPTRFTSAMSAFLSSSNYPLVNHEDVEELLYDYDLRCQGATVVITTEEDGIRAFLGVLLHEGAKIEVYSAHHHPSEYGRPTYKEEEKDA